MPACFRERSLRQPCSRVRAGNTTEVLVSTLALDSRPPTAVAVPATQVMFSKPLPDFSCRLNAFATAVTCQWLMGPCTVNDVELDDGRVSRAWHGQLRQHHNICQNTCMPTQPRFTRSMQRLQRNRTVCDICVRRAELAAACLKEVHVAGTPSLIGSASHPWIRCCPAAARSGRAWVCWLNAAGTWSSRAARQSASTAARCPRR